MSTRTPELDKKIDEWLTWDKNTSTLAAIKKLVNEENFSELSKVLLNRLSFGTAGLRGKMAAGYAAMNDLVIIQTGQGLLKYLEHCDKNLLVNNGIIIGYDGRYNSQRFAELTATIFLHSGYPVRLFSQMVPTPFVPFAVAKYKSAIGVMVTASHNPKEDNGYKVYGPNSSQIVSPVDKEIQKNILDNLVPLDTSWDTSVLKSSKLLTDPLKETLDDYLNVVKETIIPEHIKINEKAKILFTYTAMHGVGYKYVKEVFNVIGILMVPVEKQRDPHPDFPTVKFPNPEEGKSSLDLSFKTANENGSRVIIANDPDADRMAAAEKNENTGEWKVFSGNELGALLGWWCLYCFKTKYPKEPLENTYMLSSTVSSMILRSMSKKEGFNFIETLTGFKWMGNKTVELINQGKKVIFAFEEAIGYCCGTAVMDKDGVSAAFQLATLTSFLSQQGKTLTDKLQEIYNEYGYHVSLNSYFICHDGEKIKKIFERIRNFNGPNSYPSGILKEKYKISTIRDLTTGYDNSQTDNKAILPVSKSSQMITFNFTNGLVCTLRTSGTEPKIKYYTEMCAAPGDLNRTAIIATLKEMVDGVIEELLQPVENSLLLKAD
ncbi:PGM PMM I domain containing protein [Asbolus verrucosus]|uniref:PGM PMM I domain containing protein n=1 Tax=Asbolus verrucosus TaxID=1661398 RepID=A0A482W3V2_ASBVE|nr:PGM PMM I domain containing protein [Asbolus verrucosus]